MVKSFADYKLENKQPGKLNFENSYRANIVDRLICKTVDYGENGWESFNF